MLAVGSFSVSRNHTNASVWQAACETGESRLLDDLFKNSYDKRVRPVHNVNDTVVIKAGFALIRLKDIDLEAAVAKLSVWARYEWTDMGLKWQPEEYGGLDIIRIPSNLIWKPDLFVYNSADEAHMNPMDMDNTMAVVMYTGKVLFIPPQDLDVAPVYSHGKKVNVVIKIGSWTYDGFKLDLDFYNDRKAIDLTDYVPDRNYDVISTSGKKNVKRYPCCVEPYPDLTFTMELKEKS